jgi:hypothetical protein
MAARKTNNRRRPGPREPNGKLQRPPKTDYVPRTDRISDEDLASGIYPEGDVRNKPAVRDWMRECASRGPLVLPRGMEAVWTGPRPRCLSCGRLDGC